MTASKLGNQYQRGIRDHRGILFKVARAYATSPDDQEDLPQEILLNLWSSIRKFRGEAKESTWIYRVSLQTAMVWPHMRKSDLPLPRPRYRCHLSLLEFPGWFGFPKNPRYGMTYLGGRLSDGPFLLAHALTRATIVLRTLSDVLGFEPVRAANIRAGD